LVFAVIRPPEPAARIELSAVLEEALEHYEQNFISLREQAKLKGIELATDVAVGDGRSALVSIEELSLGD
jgi:hypothetical protein